jgi:predicted lipoprotein with Yx(FWY)xxD motif
MRKVRSTFLTSWIGLVALAINGCGGVQRSVVSQPESSATTRAVDPPRPTVGEAVVVRVARTAYGPALTDRRGFALYLFTHDRSTNSTCYGACATAWPPYVVSERPSNAGRGAPPRLLGSVRRRDGRTQVTYRGHPLYYYLGDRHPGQVLCQAVVEFGGTWYVVAPSGHAIH